MKIREILEEIWKRAIIGYPPTDELDKERTINEALSLIRAEIEKCVPEEKELPHRTGNNVYLYSNLYSNAESYNQAIIDFKKRLEEEV